MSLRILRADAGEGELWRSLIERLPRELQDLHYTPEYGCIYRDSYGHEPLLAAFERGSQLILHAFVRRRLDRLPFLEQGDEGAAFTDIATPYGFGGPLAAFAAADDSADCMRAFDLEFRAWARAERVAAEFVCLHPLLGNHALIAASGIAEPARAKNVVVIDLRAAPEALWAAVSRGTRSSIQRARRLGVSVEQVEPSAEALRHFRELYLQTMQRRGAAERWFFPESYFADCVRRLGSMRSALFFARCEGELAAAYLLLHDAQTAYYHFGASDERWFERRPSNLLMYETLLWAKRQGLRRYHLGGGVGSSGNDSLLRFKSSFGGEQAMLYTYGRVLNEEVYRRLCVLKCKHESRMGSVVANPDYFPLYRR